MQTTAPAAVTVLVARVLTLTADHLTPYATISHPCGGQIDQCMTAGLRDITVDDALATVLNTVRPHALQDTVRATVRASLPPAGGTVAQYAQRLRTTAA